MKINASIGIQPKLFHSELVELLKQDLLRKYQAYIDSSRVTKSADSRGSAIEFERQLVREFHHAVIIATQIDSLSSIRLISPKASHRLTKRITTQPFPLESEPLAIQSYRDRIQQCERLGEYEVAEQLCSILIDKQELWKTQSTRREPLVATLCPAS